MTAVMLLAGLLAGGCLGWLAGRWRASADVMRLNRALRQEVHWWQDAAARATDRAERAAAEARTWAEGCRQGRQEVISIVPLLIAAQERGSLPPDSGSGVADCG
jgi:hypothetical protein